MTATAAAPTPPTEAEKEAIRRLARVLWRIDIPAKSLPAEDRLAKWREGRQDYVKRARMLMKHMSVEKLQLVATPEA